MQQPGVAHSDTARPSSAFCASSGQRQLHDAVRFSPQHASSMLAQGFWTEATVHKWLAQSAAQTPDKPAIVTSTETLSYREVHRRSEQLARALRARGLNKGDVIGIQLPNIPEFMLVYFATSMLGAVLAPLHMPYRAHEMEPLLRHAGARAVICGAPVGDYVPAETFLALRKTVGSLGDIVSIGPAHPGTLSLAELMQTGPFAEIADGSAAADPAILCFTSGTSAAPKAVVHNCYTMLANNRLCAALYGLNENDILLSGAPFTHAFGICIINFALSVGATLLLLPAFRPDLLAETLASGRPTMLFAAPAHIAACLKAGLLAESHLASLRVATISGSVCPPALAHRLQELMPRGKVMQMWGMTELFMGLNTRLADSEMVRCESLGGPTPQMEVRIVDERGSAISDAQSGELQIRGPSVVARYYDNAKATAESFVDGWFRTGDLACRDAGGNFHITGRLKDLINRGGIKINPADIEALIDEHPKVLQSAIVPMPDEVLGEKACLFIVPREGATVTLAELCEWLHGKGVAKIKWPERLELIAQMPMTPTRKIIKGLLRPSQS